MPLLPELEMLFGPGSTKMSSLTGLKAELSQVIGSQSFTHELSAIVVCPIERSFEIGSMSKFHH